MSQAQMENKGKVRGDSAYEIAVKKGFSGSEDEWLDSLNGANGLPGKAATVSVGSVSTGDTASVINTGTETDAIFDFVIPGGSVDPDAPGGSYDDSALRADILRLDTEKQDVLVSNVNIKTINGLSILGSGNIVTASDDNIADVLEDAPMDGNTYGRKNALWVPIDSTTDNPDGSSNAVLYTPQILTQEQKNQVSMNTGFAQTDIYAEWEAGNYNSSGEPIEGTVHYVRSKPVPVPKLVAFPSRVQPSRIIYFDEEGNVDGVAIGQSSSQYFIPDQRKHSIAFSLYVPTSQGGSTSESKIAWAKGTVFKNSLMPIPIQEEEYIRDYTAASSFCLKCAQEFNADESPTVAGRYLWIDDGHNFYISDTLRSEKKFAFKWALPDTPDHYSMAFYGNDIIAVYATAINRNVYTENIRRNPYVLVKANNYNPHEVTFTDLSLAPSNWYANLGYWNESMALNRKAYFCEYTRPSVQKAYIWRISGSPTSASSWERLYEKDVAQTESNNGFKHFHHIQKDPYSDWIYFTTGDDEDSSFILGTADNFTTLNTIYGPNQEYCRLVNFIFTKDAVYWASDNPIQGKHSLFKAVRLSDGKMDVANAIKLYEFDHTDGNANATYCLVYMQALNCLVVLNRADAVSENTPVYVYDLDSNQMKIGAVMEKLGATSLSGFRCTYYSTYPQDNTIAVGFNQTTLGGFSYQNPNKILTNDYANVANLLLNVYRTGSGFGIGFETIR